MSGNSTTTAPPRRGDALLATLADRMGARLGTSTVFGTPVERDGVTVVPVASVRLGLGGGGGEDRDKHQDGAGAGVGGTVTPMGYIEVKDGSGAPQIWALEATTRGQLEKMGVTRESLKSGDVVKARCHPLRDKTNGCLLGFLKTSDGTIKDWDGGNAPAPKDF